MNNIKKAIIFFISFFVFASFSSAAELQANKEDVLVNYFRLENQKDGNANFSFLIKNKTSQKESGLEYGISLSDKDGTLLDKFRYSEKIDLNPGQELGMLISYDLSNLKKSASSATLFITNKSGQHLSISRADGFTLRIPKSNPKNLATCKLVDTGKPESELHCSFKKKAKVSSIEKIKINVFEKDILGKKVKSETLSLKENESEKLDRESEVSEATYGLLGLEPGFYEAEIKIDGFARNITRFYINTSGVVKDIPEPKGKITPQHRDFSYVYLIPVLLFVFGLILFIFRKRVMSYVVVILAVIMVVGIFGYSKAMAASYSGS